MVRAIMIGSSFFFGAGLVFYGWLWLLVPMAGMKPGSAALCWTRTATPAGAVPARTRRSGGK
ncbi:hypothetical protein NHF46_18585 [Arthrobacter alpinus]|nr:hypothetical protein [Arthrobacter alpinus]